MLKTKKQLLKTIAALTIALFVALLVRTVIVTVCSIEGEALQPMFLAGDRVLVNRWSYGLRVGGSGMLSYNRLWRRQVERGDIVAVNDPTDSLQAIDERHLLLLRCKHLPGETVSSYVIPSRANCADQDYYIMESVSPLDEKELGNTPFLIPEDHIIGRAFLIIYSHDPTLPLWDGWRSDRFFLLP